MHDLTPEAWAQIRYAYEHTSRPVEEICAEHGISSGTLRDRMRRWGWKKRRPPIPREGPPAVEVPESEVVAPNPWLLDPRLRADERDEGVRTIESPERPHPNPLPSRSRIYPTSTTPTCPNSGKPEFGWEREQTELAVSSSNSASAAPFVPLAAFDDARACLDSDPASIGQRLQGAVARVLPALETTLARLAGGPMPPRQMEQMARALGSLTRTLRELNGLLARYDTQEEEPLDIDALRQELARRVEGLVARRNEEMPHRYEAAWHEFAAEVQAGTREPGDGRTTPINP